MGRKHLLVLCCVAASPHAQAHPPSVHLAGPDKNAGYLVGDTLSTDASISVPPGTTLDKQSLPIPGPLNAAIELRSVEATQTPTEISIRAEYQIFLAPERVTETELPGYTIRLTAGSQPATVQIPPWPFHVSPLRVAQQSIADVADLRPNHAIEPIQDSSLFFRLAASVLVALAAAFIFAGDRGWLPNWRGKPQPFAIAARQIARAGNDPTAHYRELHRAFDITAGHHIFAGDLQNFLAAHKRFAPAQADIEGFFAASEAQFFARDTGTPPPAPCPLNLAKSLRRLERRS